MIRYITRLAALGICFVGFVASPAARITDSVPVYENAAEMNALRLHVNDGAAVRVSSRLT